MQFSCGEEASARRGCIVSDGDVSVGGTVARLGENYDVDLEVSPEE